MSHPSTARRRRVARAGAALPVTAAAVVGAVGSAASAPAASAAAPGTAVAAAATGRVYQIGPGSNAQARMTTALQNLRAGDTLKLLPGTYGMNLRPDLRLSRGTQDRRVTVTAADPAHPPVLLGSVLLDRADWWVITNIKVQGNTAGRDSFTMNSGTGWVVSGVEVTGAENTGAYANVVITTIDGWPTPTKWLFVNSCVHGGGVGPESRRGSLHEMYITSEGDNQGGLIARNTLFDTPFGAAVKLGNGGAPGAVGPDNVQVANNTMFNNGEQVLMFARTTGNSVRGNLMVGSTRKLSDGRTTAGVYLNSLVRAANTYGNLVQQNDFSGITRPLFDLDSATGTYRDGGDDGIGPAPVFGSGGCAGLKPTDAHAQLYGRYASHGLYRMP